MQDVKRPTIWIVEDEPDICCLFVDLLVLFENFALVCVDDASKVQADEQDIIFLDMRGTRPGELKAQNARVVTMSGDGSLQPDILKPFNLDTIENLIINHLEKFNREQVAA